MAEIPEPQRLLLLELAGQLNQIPGMAAVVLGGSYASGQAHADSDLDIGLCYYENSPFAIADIQALAKNFSSDGAPTVTGFYEWGAWVNGGAWIEWQHSLMYRPNLFRRSILFWPAQAVRFKN